MRMQTMPVQSIPVLGNHILIDRADNGGFVVKDFSSVAQPPGNTAALSNVTDLLDYLSYALRSKEQRAEAEKRAREAAERRHMAGRMGHTWS